MTGSHGAISNDAFLGGRVSVLQARGGAHRSGSDAVFLAAAVPADFAGEVYDFGAGTGAAGLCVAARCGAARVTLVERDAAALDLARESLALPENAAIDGRVRVVACDITLPMRVREAAGLARESADMVIMNPPYLSRDTARVTPDSARAAAHVLAEDGLEPWLRAANAHLRPKGRVTLIHRADALRAVLDALDGRFGNVRLLPLHARAGRSAIRVIVGAVKGSRAPLRVLPGLILHPAAGDTWTQEAQAIQRDGAALDLWGA